MTGDRRAVPRAGAPRGRGRVRPLAAAASSRRVRRPGAAEGAARGRADRRDRARRGARPRPARRPARAREDEPRLHHPRGARRRDPHGRRAGARAQGRPRGDPHLARGARRPLRRRDPPAEPGGRGDPLPGARGLPARHRRRAGAGGADADARPAAVHARRRDDAHRPADHAAARPLRDDLPARLLRAGRARRDRHALGADPRRRDRGGGRRARSPAARAGRRASRTGSCGACATSPRCATPARSPPRSPHEALELLEVDEEGLERTDRELLEAIVHKFGGGPVGLSTLAVVRSARSPTRSRTSTSRTCSSSASSSGRRAGASSPTLGLAHVAEGQAARVDSLF